MITVRRYTAADAQVWNELIVCSRNGNFLHDRNYMDYHADRFQDHSLIVHRHEKIVAVLPASQHGNEIRSHGGLTYGGLICDQSVGAADTLAIFEAIQHYYFNVGISTLLYKPVPPIFHRYPCEEDLYALYRMEARLLRRDASSAIALDKDFKYTKGRKWSINKAKKSGVLVFQTNSPASIYALLCEVLSKFDTVPTHSFSELTLLADRFPRNICFYEARFEGALVAGAIVYDFGNTVHTQYLAASEVGREIGALDFLLSHLIEEIYVDRRYFSFGISTEQQGNYLNTGLIAQKEGFGARTVVHDFYEWNL